MSTPAFLPPRQYSVVKALIAKGEVRIDELSELLGYRPEDLMRDIAELEGKGLISVEKQVVKVPVPTSEALTYIEHGMPEEQLYPAIDKCLERTIPEFYECAKSLLNIPTEVVSIGLQYHIRSRCIEVSNGVVSRVNREKCQELLEDARRLRDELAAIKENPVHTPRIDLLKRRRLVELRDKTIIVLKPTQRLLDLYKAGLIAEKEVLTVVKPSLAPVLEHYIIKEFDLSIEPPTPRKARKHPFMEFIDDLRDILVSMGFEEVKGPHVEAEFWNFDALFQAQDHPAREIHDTFFIKTDLKARINPQLLERARTVHESGWGYKWSPERALRLVLRSQTTAVSARAIYERGEGEYRVFTIDRNFRPENLDAKHSMEFHQLDGVIVGKNVNFKHLLYFFKELASALGVKEVWFKPGYFPFTEPSVEGYIKHPQLGWIEVFPGGVFRPEVMTILGAPNVKAIAWGIGVDRLAMTVLGLNDIRLLFARDLDTLEGIKYHGLPFFKEKTSGRDVRVVEYPL